MIDESQNVVMTGVREYAEEMPVQLCVDMPDQFRNQSGTRIVVCAKNQGGYDSTAIDLLDLIAWLRVNRPDLLSELDCPACRDPFAILARRHWSLILCDRGYYVADVDNGMPPDFDAWQVEAIVTDPRKAIIQADEWMSEHCTIGESLIQH